MRFWKKRTFLSYLLFPLSLIYLFICSIRHYCYRAGIFKIYRAPVPVIVVGNITVGGTGKTPLVIAIALALKNLDYHPGIITRGYRGRGKQWPCVVTAESDPKQVGDEAVLIALKTGLPVVAGSNRKKDCEQLLSQFKCNLIISDDGLQHYALGRKIEIAVVDEGRGSGNGFCLPAGPLREPLSRLNTVDLVMSNSALAKKKSEYSMGFVIDAIENLIDPSKQFTFSGKEKILAIAGIGNPERFFHQLHDFLGVSFETLSFPDHHPFNKTEITALSADSILMTEKDAVKCRAFQDERCYVVKGHAEMSTSSLARIKKLILS